MEKVVLITGCSSGIGRAFAIEFLKKGWVVWAAARNSSTLLELTSSGCFGIELDITNYSQQKSVIDSILEKHGRIDILINNAGYGLMGPAMDVPVEELSRQFETNLFAQIELIKQVAPVMKKQKSGKIVNIGSISGIAATPFAGPYCASKAAFHAMTDTFRMELAPFGIKVISLRPGAITSNFGKNAGATINKVFVQDSWYRPIEKAVNKRAYTSQQNATPPVKFVQNSTRKILRKNPPAIITLGKLSFILPFMKRVIPEKVLDRILMKKYGLNGLD
jgi:NAD(P)-dependent dehydrogenase (short-subunit alcohol dehydrogenase family)